MDEVDTMSFFAVFMSVFCLFCVPGWSVILFFGPRRDCLYTHVWAIGR